MATANEELKTVVRNWIANRIHSTNDDYLASNDYVKFHRIEEEGATSGVYSTILKDTDASGQIEFVDTLDANESESDGSMKVVGLNMFNDAVATLENSITSSNGDVSALTTRIAELEKRLETLISAFQDDPTATQIPTALHDKIKSKTPMTIREIFELERIISSSQALGKPTDLTFSIYEDGAGIFEWEKTFDDTDAETTSIINLYNALKESASISEPFHPYYGTQLYKALLKVENKTTDMTTYIQKWEDANSDVTAKREAFFQKIAEYTTAIENHAAFPFGDHVLFNLIQAV